MRPTYLLAASLALILGCSAGSDPQGTTGSLSSGTGDENSGGSSGSSGDGGSDSQANTVAASVGTGSFNGEECGKTAYGALVPASILIVLDKSGSMAGGDGIPDKWAPTVSALTTLTSTAPAELKIGLLPFPGDTCDFNAATCTDLQSPSCQAALADGCCEDVSPAPAVQVKPLGQSGPEIVSWLNANGPTGGTPTLWALKRGYNLMKTLDTQGERFILLVTDGQPNVYAPAMEIPGFPDFSIPESNIECKTEADIVAEAATASASTPVVRTFVIGAPGSEGAAGFFTQIATAGATAPDGYFQIGSANYQADLQAAFDAITGQVSDCIFALPEGEEDVDPTKVNVVIETTDGQQVEILRDPAHLDGWDYTDASQTKIQLFGPACELYKSQAQNQITIILGCETIIK